MEMQGAGRQSCARAARGLSTAQWKRVRDADRFANMAVAEGLRSRAAYKLIDIDKRFGRFLRQGARVVDLGAAPGGFATVAAAHVHLDTSVDEWDGPLRINSLNSAVSPPPPPRDVRRTVDGDQRRRRFGGLICVDLQDMERVPGARFVRGDFMDPETQATVRRLLRGSEADVVLSDLSPSTTGDKGLNHDRILALAEEAAAVAKTLLRNGGVFVCKLFNGAGERAFRDALREDFLKVKAVKPDASRRTSTEMFYVATGFVPAHLQGVGAAAGSDALPGADALVDDLAQLRRHRRRRTAAVSASK